MHACSRIHITQLLYNWPIFHVHHALRHVTSRMLLRGRWRHSWHATSNVKATSNMSTTQDSLLIQTRHTASTRTCWHFAFALCCHSNTTCPPIANPPNSGQLGVTPCHSLSNTRMWANAQPDGRPAEHRWRPLFNAAKFGWRPLLDAVQ